MLMIVMMTGLDLQQIWSVLDSIYWLEPPYSGDQKPYYRIRPRGSAKGLYQGKTLPVLVSKFTTLKNPIDNNDALSLSYPGQSHYILS